MTFKKKSDSFILVFFLMLSEQTFENFVIGLYLGVFFLFVSISRK